jgi:hypothetical protein
MSGSRPPRYPATTGSSVENSPPPFPRIAGGLLLVGGDGADALGALAAVPQLLARQRPPELGQPGAGECAVVVLGPGLQQRDAFGAGQIGKRVLIDHES